MLAMKEMMVTRFDLTLNRRIAQKSQDLSHKCGKMFNIVLSMLSLNHLPVVQSEV